MTRPSSASSSSSGCSVFALFLGRSPPLDADARSGGEDEAAAAAALRFFFGVDHLVTGPLRGMPSARADEDAIEMVCDREPLGSASVQSLDRSIESHFVVGVEGPVLAHARIGIERHVPGVMLRIVVFDAADAQACLLPDDGAAGHDLDRLARRDFVWPLGRHPFIALITEDAARTQLIPTLFADQRLAGRVRAV
jgi:hypothetical protein